MGVLRGGGGNGGWRWRLMAVRGGVTEGVKLLRLRITIHTMKFSLQNSFGESHFLSIVRLRALIQLNALRALSVYPVFEDEK